MGVTIKLDKTITRAGGCEFSSGDYLTLNFTGPPIGVAAELQAHPAGRTVSTDSGFEPEVRVKRIGAGGAGQVLSYSSVPTGSKHIISFTLGTNAVEEAGSLHELRIRAFDNLKAAECSLTVYYFVQVKSSSSSSSQRFVVTHPPSAARTGRAKAAPAKKGNAGTRKKGRA